MFAEHTKHVIHRDARSLRNGSRLSSIRAYNFVLSLMIFTACFGAACGLNCQHYFNPKDMNHSNAALRHVKHLSVCRLPSGYHSDDGALSIGQVGDTKPDVKLLDLESCNKECVHVILWA